MRLLEPETPAQVAEMIAAAGEAAEHIAIRGGGTKADWGHDAPPADATLSTLRLAQLVSHAHGDLTATVEAGMKVRDLNRLLSSHGQWLPVDSAFVEATVGGILATNDSGPLRQRFGTPRDLLIGITMATPSGTLVKAGGAVVKNVAGYDLGKLVTGSFGSLAVIVNATFKLVPLPRAWVTCRASYADADAVASVAAHLAASALDPFALEIHVPDFAAPTFALLVRFASSMPGVPLQAESVETVLRSLRAGTVSRLIGEEEEECWQMHRSLPWTSPGAVVSLAWLPASLPEVLQHLRLAASRHDALELVSRAGIGSGLLRLHGSTSAIAAELQRLRATPLFSHATLLRADSAIKQLVDPWPDPGALRPVYAALKQTFDPARVLNSRGPL